MSSYVDIQEHSKAIAKPATSCLAIFSHDTCHLACMREILLIKPLESKMGEVTPSDTDRNKPNTQGQTGN